MQLHYNILRHGAQSIFTCSDTVTCCGRLQVFSKCNQVETTQRYTKQAKAFIQSTATTVDRHCAVTTWSVCDIIYTYGDNNEMEAS